MRRTIRKKSRRGRRRKKKRRGAMRRTYGELARTLMVLKW